MHTKKLWAVVEVEVTMHDEMVDGYYEHALQMALDDTKFDVEVDDETVEISTKIKTVVGFQED